MWCVLVVSWFGRTVVATAVSLPTASLMDLVSTPSRATTSVLRSVKECGRLDNCMGRHASGISHLLSWMCTVVHRVFLIAFSLHEAAVAEFWMLRCTTLSRLSHLCSWSWLSNTVVYRHIWNRLRSDVISAGSLFGNCLNVFFCFDVTYWYYFVDFYSVVLAVAVSVGPL